MTLRSTFIVLTLFWTSFALAHPVGFDQTVLFTTSSRPLNVSIWFPSKVSSPVTRIADNLAFVGTDVVTSFSPMKSLFPLVIISHGYRGNWRNQNWLATGLAQQGYIVASIDHPGTTSFDHSATAAAKWWERPGDLSRLLDWLLKDSKYQRQIDKTSITAIGHSLGGWTVMALAGAQFDREQLKQECQVTKNPRVCGLMPELGLDNVQKGEPTGNLSDERITRVVSLDLGLARSFSRQSLRSMTTPTLILAAGVDIGNLPQEEESGFLAKHISSKYHVYIVYPDAAHFSFMQLCKPGAIELLEEEEPGDGIVCKDGNGRSRESLHQTMLQDIMRFIQNA